MRFCYPDYARRCLDAGVGEFAISLWGHTPAVHDRLAGRPGAFERTEMGLKHLVDFGARPTVDFLVTTWTVDTLPEALTEVAGVGVRSFRLWVFSLFGSGGRRPELMPSLRAVGEAAAAAAAAVEPLGGRVVTSHVMPCLLGSRAGLYSSIRELELTVVTKDGSFAGEDSPFEAGTQVPACAGCRHSGCCLGPRPEYLERFGDAEFRAVP
jgi:MoaA/NifB/PqqE/SkfB family radical SAM enzyme